MQATQKLPHFIERNLGNLLIVAFLSLLYAPIVMHWWDGWLNKSISIEHEYFSHGLIGLPYAAYLIFGLHRKKWQRLEDKMHPLGGFFLVLGVIFYLTGSIELVNLSLPMTVMGIFLWLKGVPGLKLNGFPLILILLATPTSVPYLLTPYTLPLQKFIAGTAGFILQQLRVNANVDGIYLYVNNIPVEVAPYCAGLKMLFTSLYVALLLLHWSGNLDNRNRVISLLTGAAVISIIANIIRNTLLAIFHGNGEQKAFEILHDSWGGDLYSMVMLLTIVGLNWMMDHTETKYNETPELENDDSLSS